MRVSELMTRNVVTVKPWESCRTAAERMCREKLRHLPVVDENDMLVGIVTDRDLRHRLFVPGVFKSIGTLPVDALLAAVTVKEVMSTPVVTASPNDELEEAARAMLEDKVGSLPIVDGGRVVGILTETDLLRRIVHEDSRSAEIECIVVSFP
jgi:CBS domain-containing protein